MTNFDLDEYKYPSLEWTLRRTQWQADAAGAARVGVQREAQWEAANMRVSRARVGRGTKGIGDGRVSLDPSGGAARLGLATHASR